VNSTKPAAAFLGAVDLAVRPVAETVHAVGIAAIFGDLLCVVSKPQQAALVDDAEQHLAIVPQHAAGRTLVRTRDEARIASL